MQRLSLQHRVTRRAGAVLAGAALACTALGHLAASSQQAAPGSTTVTFERQEIRREFGVGYAVTTADMNADGKPDVVAISGTQLVWFENPTWKEHIVLDGKTPKDNVTLAPHDIDGDGRMDVAIGAAWNPRDTVGGGTLHWTKQTADGSWPVSDITSEPTLHRIKWADVDGKGGPELIVTPLHGRGTSPPEWPEAGTRIVVLSVPAQPDRQPWPSEIADDSFHILHNFLPVRFTRQDRDELLTASREGLHLLTRTDAGTWQKRKVGEGSPGEIKMGRVGGRRMLATIEPWHGTSVVVYREPDGGAASSALWPRSTVDATLTGGHAIAWADIDGDGDDELVAGWRDGNVGLVAYDVTKEGVVERRTPIDMGGMATEDVAAADLDGDGRPEIIAAGRRTSNVVIYWNRTGR